MNPPEYEIKTSNNFLEEIFLPKTKTELSSVAADMPYLLVGSAAALDQVDVNSE